MQHGKTLGTQLVSHRQTDRQTDRDRQTYTEGTDKLTAAGPELLRKSQCFACSGMLLAEHRCAAIYLTCAAEPTVCKSLHYLRLCRSCNQLSDEMTRGRWLCLPLPGSRMRMRAGFWPKVWAPVCTALVRVSSTVLLPPSCHAMSGMVSLMSVMPTLAHSSSRLMMKSCSAHHPTCFR